VSWAGVVCFALTSCGAEQKFSVWVSWRKARASDADALNLQARPGTPPGMKNVRQGTSRDRCRESLENRQGARDWSVVLG
jgi:hypothetical protein